MVGFTRILAILALVIPACGRYPDAILASICGEDMYFHGHYFYTKGPDPKFYPKNKKAAMQVVEGDTRTVYMTGKFKHLRSDCGFNVEKHLYPLADISQ